MCAAAFVRGDDVLHKLFTELAYRYNRRIYKIALNIHTNGGCCANGIYQV
ncbi:unnamed protein product, partial [Musa acuminata subsp. malaccensis]